MVPNVKNVQNLSILDIAKELQRLGELGKAGKIGAEDLADGTFSISNIGSFMLSVFVCMCVCVCSLMYGCTGSIGGTYATPLIMVPQVVIGAIGRMEKV